jgi:SAM-dependent methyltransferase
MEQSGHRRQTEKAFTEQASSFSTSAVANADSILDLIVEQAEPRPSERWLEAACGPGVVSRRLAPLVRAVHGIDLTPAMIEIARREACAADLGNVTFEIGDATETGFEAASFDGAVTRFSIHHLPVPSRLFNELARLVRPGGKIVIVDHVADDDAEARAWSQEVERLRDPSHWACLSETGLRALGEEAGFEPTDERRVAFELDFDDWLSRGTSDPAARELVELSVATRPGGTDSFSLTTDGDHRILTLQMWVGAWRRPDRRATSSLS